MPRLHVHIRHVTNTDPISPLPKDAIEPDTGEDEDAGKIPRKRRRIETIANQYIKLGRVPLIVSAGLRGPFKHGWKNPWIPPKPTGEDVRPKNVRRTESSKNANADSTRAKDERDRTNRTKPNSSVPSPEASRGLEHGPDSVLPPDDSQEAPASLGASTAPQDHPAARELSSAEPNKPVTFANIEDNPFWLRRPQLKPVAFGGSTNGNVEPAPTRIRKRQRPAEARERLQVVTPKQHVGSTSSSPGRDQAPEPGSKSGASASMILTSLVEAAQIKSHSINPETSAKRNRKSTRPEMVAGHEDASISAGPTLTVDQNIAHDEENRDAPQHAATLDEPTLPNPRDGNANHSSSFTPIKAASLNRKAIQDRNITEPKQQATGSEHAQQAPDSTSNTVQRLPKPKVHAATESGSQAGPSQSKNTAHMKSRKSRKNQENSARHEHVTSPTLASSTGLTYRKVGEEKRAKINSKSKPRPVTFNSSSFNETRPPELAAEELHPSDQSNKRKYNPTAQSPAWGFDSVNDDRPERPDIYDVPESPKDNQQSYKSSRTSFSTQATLMMAQMDFQDGTMPSMTADQPTRWMQQEHGTPQPDPDAPSQAFTPFHEFNAGLEDQPVESAIPDMPISTQDLFAAVSPFAMSTVKKSTRLQTNNLKFSVFASGEQDTPSHGGGLQNGVKSSTRKPLKAKNSRVSFQGSQSEKGSQGETGSQDSTPRLPKCAMKGVELPQLDFHTSLDDLRRSSDLNFTDRFLLNLNDMT